LLRQSRYT